MYVYCALCSFSVCIEHPDDILHLPYICITTVQTALQSLFTEVLALGGHVYNAKPQSYLVEGGRYIFLNRWHN